jgi:uridine kinase
MRTGRILIGIGGPSGSGKTLLAEALAGKTDGTVHSLDHYYRDLSQLPAEQRERWNFDDPASLDWDLVVAQLAALKSGETIERPRYNFATHTREAGSEAVRPGAVVIVEGIFALHHEAVRALYDTRVFVELEDEVCFARRLERDMLARGRTRESVVRQYEETVRPMCERYILPARAYADVVVRGDGDLAESVRAVLRRAR